MVKTILLTRALYLMRIHPREDSTCTGVILQTKSKLQNAYILTAAHCLQAPEENFKIQFPNPHGSLTKGELIYEYQEGKENLKQIRKYSGLSF